MTSQIYAGVDEVGRGCLAGPVVSAAIILKKEIDRDILKDSKKLSERKRILIADYILNNSLSIGIGVCSNYIVDDLNIHNASLLAMERAIMNLTIMPSQVLIDGLFAPHVDVETSTIIKGDEKIPEISAASIIAKVLRDNYMAYLDRIVFGYGFSKHKGYGTKEHVLALELLGPSIFHRFTFKPVCEL